MAEANLFIIFKRRAGVADEHGRQGEAASRADRGDVTSGQVSDDALIHEHRDQESRFQD